jgi:hypothetical protein
MKEFSLHSPSVPANALGEREIAEIFVVEVDFSAVGNNLTAHKANWEPILAVADLELKAVLELVPRLGDEQPVSLNLPGRGPSARRVMGPA